MGLNAQPDRCRSGVSSNGASNPGKSSIASSVSFFCMAAGIASTGRPVAWD
jgi:hypothetical protein